MKKVMDNMGLKSNPVTTILGWLFVLIAVALLFIMLFAKTMVAVTWHYPTFTGVAGLLLLISPDTLVGIIKKKTE